MLTRDVRWTTDLGNAFLAQQADVLAAVQRMRAMAEQNGRLQSTPQQAVTSEPPPAGQYGPGPIQIQPVNPQVVYVPTYNPEYVWGAPAVGVYRLWGTPRPRWEFCSAPLRWSARCLPVLQASAAGAGASVG